ELLRESAECLWQQQLAAAPVMRDRREIPHAQREARQAEHHQPTQIDTSCQHGVERDRADLEDAGREDRLTDLQGAETAHMGEEQRGQVDRGKDADAGDEGKEATQGEVSAAQCAEIDHWLAEAQAAPDERDARDARYPRSGPDGVIAKPIPAWT